MCDDIASVASLKKRMNSIPLGKSSILVSVTLIFFLLLLSSLGNASASGIQQTNTTDSDGDGIIDSVETTLGTLVNNKFGDKDSDGLYDFEEYLGYYGNGGTANPTYHYDNATSVVDGLGDLYHLFGLSSNKTGGYLRNQVFTAANGGFTNYLLWNVNFTGDTSGGGSNGATYENNVMQNIIFGGGPNSGGSYSGAVTYKHNVMNNVIYSGRYAGGNVADVVDVNYINNSLVNVIFSGQYAGGRADTDGQVYYRDNTFSDVIFSGEYAGSRGFGDNGIKTNNIILSDNEDSDNDGLGDGWEYLYRNVSGVDPRSPANDSTLTSNTDGDGLNIAQEAKAFSSPVSDDTDSDGLNDSYEVDLNTNTQLDDTDGDSLLDKWEVTYRSAPGVDPTIAVSSMELASDTDMDGLSLLEEYDENTNPGAEDTDGDGLPDGWEVTYDDVSGVDPLDMAMDDVLTSDTDMDGLSLLEEGKANTNSTLNDTDRDGLLDKWEVTYSTAPGVNATMAANSTELASDTDKDGLTLTEEGKANTNPMFNDTDKDGLLDKWEVTYSTVPGVNATMTANSTELAYDTDDDGLTLLEEGRANTNPMLNDSDSDGLLDKWEVTYSTAPGVNATMEVNSTELASDTDKDGLTLLEEFKANTNPMFNDTDSDGLLDKWEVTYSTAPGVDPVVTISASDLFSDADNDSLTLLEEFKANTNPASNDTDRDGLPDAWEVTYSNVSGVDPLVAATETELDTDTDGDGLNLTEEFKANTNPASNDTDGDGLPDAWEVTYSNAAGVNPLVAATAIVLDTDTDGDGLTLLEEAEANKDPETADNPMQTSTTDATSTSSSDESSFAFLVVLTIFAFFSVALVIYRMRRRML